MNRSIFAALADHSEYNEAFYRLSFDLVLAGDFEGNLHRKIRQVRAKLHWWSYPSEEAIALSLWVDVAFFPSLRECGCCGQLMFDGPQPHQVGFDTLAMASDISKKIKNQKRWWLWWFLALASCVLGSVVLCFLWWRRTYPVAAESPSIAPVSTSTPKSIPTPKALSKPLPMPNGHYRHIDYVTTEQRLHTIFGDKDPELHWKPLLLTILTVIVGLFCTMGVLTVHQELQPSARSRQRLDTNREQRRQQQNSTRVQRRQPVARHQQRASRRQNRSRQVFGRTNVHVSVPNDEDRNEAVALNNALILCSGRDLLHTQVAINAKESKDSCPICLATFGKDLMDTYCIVLSCKHACCVTCLKAIEDSGRPSDCPCCREPHRIGLERLKDILWPVVANRMQLLPGLSLEDKRSILDLLLKHHKYRISKIDQALEDMLLGSIATVWPEWTPEQKDWTSEEKAVIFDQAQRPVNNIRQQLNQAKKELRKANGAKMYNERKKQVENLQKQLLTAIQNARDDTYTQMNSRGGMGVAQVNKGTTLDYHGLDRQAALRKFDDLVVPILPVLGKVNIITGKGKHSRGGVGVLQQALIDHIESHREREHLHWKPVTGNDGMIHVTWD